MKVKITGEQFLKEYQKNKELCLNYYGKGTFSIGFLGSEVDRLKKLNNQMAENCKTTTKIDAMMYGGKKYKLEVPTITLSEEYKNNNQLIMALEFIIDILIFKNSSILFDYELELLDEQPTITLTDFEFTDEEVLLFASEKNCIHPKYENKIKEENLSLENNKNQETLNENKQSLTEYTNNYKLGQCPFCHDYGDLYIAMDINSRPYIICDECDAKFATMEDVKNKKMCQRIGYRCVSLKEAIELGYGDYIYVVRNNKPEKLIK